jgi:cellulose synthase/poly-beta-1,6-N-acetylglucosamine synthase-like glycosyltransferase
MAAALMIIYLLALTFILLYSIVQLNLVILYVRYHRKQKRAQSRPKTLFHIPDEELPTVTVQLPVFNELYVVERLIDNIAQFDYPGDKFEVQVLDDSTDETLEISRKKVREWQQKGIDITLITRSQRTGFKAGALQEGLKTARGEYIVIFDADFVPNRDFLKRTIPYFYTDPKIGVVQTRWEHMNKDYSFLTRVQAFALDAHFTVEQQGRNAGGYFINFNGTAGVWRRECIVDAGGWQADTLTEDLDLSYRAQLKGWKFIYLEDLPAPAELPMVINAVKSQQFRWTKGGVETAKKIIGRIWRSNIKLSQKIHGTAHLLSSYLFLPVLICSVFSVPLLLINNITPVYSNWLKLSGIFIISLVHVGIFYYCSLYRRSRNGLFALGYFFAMFPLFLAMSMGISLHNTTAVLEGSLGFKTPFIRTPKFNPVSRNKTWKANKYVNKKIGLLNLMEIFLCCYFLIGIAVGIYLKDFGMLPFHMMLAVGFGLLFYYSLKHARFVKKNCASLLK